MMKTRLTLWGLVAAALVAGCAPRPLLVRNTIGPQLVGVNRQADGNLIVYTATQVSGYTGSEFPVYSPYRLYSEASVAPRKIQNRAGSFDADPQVVSLPPGEYRVEGLAEGAGEIAVPVRIEAGRTTVVDLAHLGESSRTAD